MDKVEFIDELRKSLTDLSADEKAEVIDFYIKYIDEQCMTGRSEEDVIDDLGSPRLLARTIMDDYKKKSDRGNSGNNHLNEDYDFVRVNISGWKARVAAALILILFVVCIALLTAGLITIFVKIVLPVTLILAIIWIIKFIFGK